MQFTTGGVNLGFIVIQVKIAVNSEENRAGVSTVEQPVFKGQASDKYH